MNEVYITRIAQFLPNECVSNDEMEEYLGMIDNKRSKSKPVVLRNNGIKNRYYAIKKDGTPTHTNAELTALAVKKLFKDNPEEIKEMDFLSCGTSSPDQLMPSHGLMVHGELPESDFIEVTSPSGNCCSGLHSIKHAFMGVKTGERNKAVATGSERLSCTMRHENFEEEVQKLKELEQTPVLAFEKDFLRWMLSDGAGAFLLENKKSDTGFSYRIEWIDSVSYANDRETCMYQALEKTKDGKFVSFKDMTPEEIMHHSTFSIKQNVKLIDDVVKMGFDKLKKSLDNSGYKGEDIDYFLPHLSSFYFEPQVIDALEKNGINIPREKWFTNLAEVGNIGSASIYLMLNDLEKTGKLKVGQKIILAVPESARFSYAYALLTVC